MNQGSSRLFRRNLQISPIIGPVGLTPIPTRVGRDVLNAASVTSFKVINPNPFWVWLRGWNGTSDQMPPVKEQGHYVGPGVTDINASQIPDWVAFVADDEPGFPIYDANGQWLYEGMRTRCILIYGSGA